MKNISIILVKPQMGENIGATARIMKNFGIQDLRIVSPRDGWPNKKAQDMSANASDIIEKAIIYNELESAIADINLLFATASKSRDMEKPVITPEFAANLYNPNLKMGFIFGKESSGLENSDISMCNHLISIPVSPEYDSLNLAQAVCVICYELFKEYNKQNSSNSNLNTNSLDEISSREDINQMINFLERELTDKNFFQVANKKQGMMINIRNIFTKHFYTKQEIRTLRGIFSALKK
jgi:tRNA/rRNA methyltransferase